MKNSIVSLSFTSLLIGLTSGRVILPGGIIIEREHSVNAEYLIERKTNPTGGFLASSPPAFQSAVGTGCSFALDVFTLLDQSYNQLTSRAEITADFKTIVNYVEGVEGSQLGLGLFTDKNIPPLGFNSNGWTDFCLNITSPLSHPDDLDNILTGDFCPSGGYDWPEAHMEAMLRAAIAPQTQWRNSTTASNGAPIQRVLVVITDSIPHLPNDAAAAANHEISLGLDYPEVSANNLTADILGSEGVNYGCQFLEYPSIGRVSDVLKDTNIIPIFLVAPATYTCIENAANECVFPEMEELANTTGNDAYKNGTAGMIEYYTNLTTVLDVPGVVLQLGTGFSGLKEAFVEAMVELGTIPQVCASTTPFPSSSSTASGPTSAGTVGTTSGTVASGATTSGTVASGATTSGTAGTVASGATTAGTVTSAATTSGTVTSAATTSGTVASGATTAGTVGSGATTSGTVASGATTSGTVASGATTGGTVASGVTTGGTVASGVTTAGTVASGVTTEATTTAGTVASGATTSGTVASGVTTAGTVASGVTTAGTVASGATTAGTVASGATTSGTVASGATTSGTVASGATTSGTVGSGATTSGTVGSGATTSGTVASGATTSGTVASGATTSGTVASGVTTSGTVASGATTAGTVASGATTSGPTTGSTSTSDVTTNAASTLTECSSTESTECTTGEKVNVGVIFNMNFGDYVADVTEATP